MIIIINGNNFNNIDGFYKEIILNFAPSIDWEINLDSLHDILYGGFGVFEYGEEITLKWENYSKSKVELEEINDILEIIESCENIYLILN
ncbi:MAG: Barstar (barnase inhibitor) [Candidatus Gracilibacteria bacterium]|nr:Barstar (barnase inhibitor) [Candidatus Gracilibacteria bacterium]